MPLLYRQQDTLIACGHLMVCLLLAVAGSLLGASVHTTGASHNSGLHLVSPDVQESKRYTLTFGTKLISLKLTDVKRFLT
jgi:hypothetical protein